MGRATIALTLLATLVVAGCQRTTGGTMGRSGSGTTDRPASPPRSNDVTGPITERCREGEVAYVPMRRWDTTFYVRAQPSARQVASTPPEPSLYFPDIDGSSRNVDLLVHRILGGTSTERSRDDAEIWRRFRRLWSYGAEHIRQDTDELMAITNGDRWITVGELAAAERRLGYVPTGTCFSTAQTYASLMARMGVPRSRFAVATAFYGDTASHVYLALFINDRWHYFDPSFVRSSPLLPVNVADARSFGTAGMGIDYPHPIQMIFVGRDPLDGKLPLLTAASGFTWDDSP